MREIGIVTLLSVAVTAAAPSAPVERPAVFSTAKTTADFAHCFARSQDRRGQAWWFVSHDHGGALSNLGNRSGAATYFVAIQDRGERREIALDRQGAADGARQAIKECV